MCDPRLRQLPLSVLLRNMDGPMHTRDPIEQIDDDWVYATPAEVRAEIDRRFPVQPAAPVSGWQPVGSAPTNREVLIYTSHHLFDVALKEPDGRWWPARTGKPLACGVVAWMPLPEVPK